MGTDIYKYLRKDKLPHIWCPGCGHGTIMGNFIRAFDQSRLDPGKTSVVSGIGCSGRATGYLNFDTLHGTHGRAIPFATGIKLGNPDMNVIVFTGDGDGTAIGGNHLIHAARRNIDITVILMNNQIYGMTSGQYSPMTPTDALATTAPYGNIDQNFDICELARAAGSTFVARGTAYQSRQLINIIKAGLEHKGFSFIEVFSQCPINFGRRNGMGDAVQMLDWQKDHGISLAKWEKMTAEEREGKFPTGILYQNEKPEYTSRYLDIIEKARKEVR